MKKTLRKVLCTTVATMAVFSAVGCSNTTQETNKITKIVAFGDSYSDNGGANAVSKSIVEEGTVEEAFIKPGELYFENRYSNGKTAIEVAAELANLPLENYAIGGATSGYENYSDWMDSQRKTGVLGQIETYGETLEEGKVDENALYFILAGTNDYCKFIDYSLPGTVEGVAEQVVKNLETAVRKLADLGAKNILLSTVHNVAVMPYEITEGREESAAVFAKTANAILPEVVEKLEEELKINIAIYDITQTTADIKSNPEKYGMQEFVNVVQPTWPEVLPAVTENVDTYMFFDEWHPTAATHKILGQAIYETIKTIQ